MTPATLAAARTIDAWREDLTDFSTRNPLLYFKASRAGRLVLTDPADDLFRRVQSGARIDIAALQPAPVPSARRGAPPELPDMPSVCTKLRRNARTFIEESGINPLALAIDLCEWDDPLAPVGSSRRCRAPAVIVPVTLTATGRNGAILGRDEGTDVVINPVLRRALFRHFQGVTLPDDPDDDQASLAMYRRCLEPLLGDPHARFSIVPHLALGLFSFSRLVMVEDLERNESLIVAHPLLRSLLKLSEDPGLASLPDAARLDEWHERRPALTVLPADSSQQVAIEAVKAGTSLIVQGPPGTGKSQTITNVIAELLAQGKKVLFVSAKRAALDVVLQRLTEVGLRDLCLAAHDSADKKAVIADLYQTCEKARTYQAPAGSDVARREHLRRCRQELADHVHLLHTHDPAMDMSLFDAYGQLADQRGTPALMLPVQDARLFAQDQIGAIRHLIAELSRYADLVTCTTRSLWHQVSPERFADAADQQRAGACLQRLETSIGALERVAGEIAARTGLSLPDSRIGAVHWAIEVAETISGGPELDAALLSDDPARPSIYDLVRRDLLSYRQERDTFLASYEERLFDLPLDELHARLSDTYASPFRRMFNAAYKRDRATFAALQRQDGPLAPQRLNYVRLRSAVTAACNLTQRAHALDAYDAARTLLGRYYRGVATDADLLARALEQSNHLIRLLDSHQADPRAVCAHVATPGATEHLAALAAEGRRQIDVCLQARAEIRALFPPTVLRDWDGDTDLRLAKQTAARLRQELPRLRDWLDYQRVLRQIDQVGFPTLQVVLADAGLPPASWTDAFVHGMLQRWVEHRHAQHPQLATFQHSRHERLITDFGEMDREGFTTAQSAIRQAHACGVQRFLATNPQAQYKRLAQEAHKSRQIWPLRKLMSTIPELLLQVKPCWMLSPLTVTQIVDAARTRFDVVIFDEASQLRVEETVCAIVRAPQAVVVGDDQQLPPTSFFDQMHADEDPEADDRAFESILTQCGGHLPNCTLRWHYRSKHETLIAFSNRTYYKGELITFPNAERRKDLGLRFHHVPNGVYDRGGTRTNAREAQTVAELILKHYRGKTPASLGVIALSQPQQEAIRDALDTLLARHPAVAIPEEGPDGLFIKNLENVQGDERDVILLSIGYGRDANGMLSHNFGPLNKSGGQKRLNVAITRARQRLTIVSSLTDTDLDTSKSKAEAIQHLKEYLAYARSGGQGGATSGAADGYQPTPLAADIRRQLAARGYTVETGVGSSEQRIELAIVERGRYLLGVESDGPIYHGLPTVRDRDCLRPHVLEGLGWRLFRVWSPEWLRDPDAVLARVYDTLQQAASPQPPPAAQPCCPRCGGSVRSAAAYCGHCGAALIIPLPPIPTVAATITMAQGTGTPLPPAAPGQPLTAGTLLNGRYCIEAVLGQGAFGRVYRARDTGDPRQPLVAIKELLDHQFTTPDEKEEAVRWFKREVGTLLQISHPSIPTIHAYCTADSAAGPYYLVMDYIEGKTLEDAIDDRGGTIAWSRATMWTIELCKVLAYLHGQTPPYVFRDLKPPNIMIDAATNTPKLIDFGIARQVAGRANHTAIGTWGYVPMEQLMGQTEPRSDIYALGATLHAMLTGQRPEQEFRRLQALGHDVPRTLQIMFPRADAVNPAVPAALADVVERATAFEASHRYADATSMGLALAPCLGLTAAGAARMMRP